MAEVEPLSAHRSGPKQRESAQGYGLDMEACEEPVRMVAYGGGEPHNGNLGIQAAEAEMQAAPNTSSATQGYGGRHAMYGESSGYAAPPIQTRPHSLSWQNTPNPERRHTDFP